MSEERKKNESLRRRLKETNHGNKPGSSLVDKSRLPTSVGMSEEEKRIVRERFKKTSYCDSSPSDPSVVSGYSLESDDIESMLQTTRVNKSGSSLVAGTPAKGESGLTTSERVSLPQRVMSKKKEQIISERFKKTNYGNDSLLDSSVVSDCSSERDDAESMLQTNRGNKPRSLLAATPLIPGPVVPEKPLPSFYWMERAKEIRENNNVR